MSVGGTAGSAGNAGGSPGGASGVGGAAPSICANPTFAFCDDFEDGDADGWMVEEGNWIVDTDGSRVYVGSPPNGYIGGTFLSTAGSTSWADQIVQATIKVIRFEQALSKRLASADRTEREAPDVVEQTGPSGAGIFARQQGSDFYTFQIDALGDLRLTRGSGPLSGTGSCGTVMNALTTDRWYTLRLEVTGTSQQQRHLVTWLSTDGTNFTQVHDCTLSGMGQPQNGGAGLILVASADGSEAAITAAFDDFTVTAP